jgi:Tfp pilus assembly protein PilO
MTNRELVLGWITLVAVILGVTYWVGIPKYRAWKESVAEMETLETRMQHARHLLKRRGQIDKELDAFKEDMPRYPADKQVTAEMLSNLERTARQHGLILLRRDPDKERKLDDLYEVSIRCSWEGNLEALVRFLYAIQSQGAMMDIRQLTVLPVQKQPGRLKGGFTVDYAYSREGVAVGTGEGDDQ